MKVRFFVCVCCARDFEETRMMMMMMMMMSGGDIICAGDSLSPWAGGDLFEFERYFDIYLFSLRRRYFFAVVVVRARKSERERERERRQTGRASALRFTLLRFLERVDHHHSFIHHLVQILIIWCLPLEHNKKRNIFRFLFSFLSQRSNRWMMGLDSNHIFILTHYKKLLNNKIGRRATTPIRLRDRSRGKV